MSLEDGIMKIIPREGENLRRRALREGIDVNNVCSFMEWQLPLLQGMTEALVEMEDLEAQCLEDDVK